ncbi:hypothetical protein D3C80_1573740 [compost metagenome]
MDGADEYTLSRFDPERAEPVLQFPRTFVVVGDAGDATRSLHILGKDPGKLDRQGLGLATSGTCENDAVPGRLIGLPLTVVRP